jgi:hypothetical protein
LAGNLIFAVKRQLRKTGNFGLLAENLKKLLSIHSWRSNFGETGMSTCPNCGAPVTENAEYCNRCKAATTPQTPTPSTVKQTFQTTSNLAAQLEKELKRTQTLSYAAAGLGIAILAVLILLAIA